MNLATSIAFVLLSTSLRAPKPTVREITLDPNRKVHSVAVTAWPGIVTAIKLPDTFGPEGVACADCFDPSESISENSTDERRGLGDRNWLLEKRPKDQLLLLRLARVPSRENPPSGFATNIIVTLENSVMLNLQLGVWQPPTAQQPGASEGATTDAVVDILYPSGDTTSGRLNREREKVQQEETHRREQDEDRLLRHLSLGNVKCRALKFGFSVRQDDLAVHANQLCRFQDKEGEWFSVRYTVENRSKNYAIVAGGVLQASDDPELADVAPSEVEDNFTGHRSLNFGEAQEGVALLRLKGMTLGTRMLRLRVDMRRDEPISLTVDGFRWLK